MASSCFTTDASWSTLPKLQSYESRFVPVSDFSKNFPVVKCSITTQTRGIFQESLTTIIIIIILIFFFLKKREQKVLTRSLSLGRQEGTWKNRVMIMVGNRGGCLCFLTSLWVWKLHTFLKGRLPPAACVDLCPTPPLRQLSVLAIADYMLPAPPTIIQNSASCFLFVTFYTTTPTSCVISSFSICQW